MFGYHTAKLKEIETFLSKGKYPDAKKIVEKHLKYELQGKTILNDLRGYINDYENLLIELKSDIDALSHETTTNRLLRREEAKSKVKLCEQKLLGIVELLKAEEENFKE